MSFFMFSSSSSNIGLSLSMLGSSSSYESLEAAKIRTEEISPTCKGWGASFESFDCKLSNNFSSYLGMIILKNMKTLKDFILKMCKLDYIGIVDDSFLIQWWCA